MDGNPQFIPGVKQKRCMTICMKHLLCFVEHVKERVTYSRGRFTDVLKERAG
jgi:hypothetical protein